jgi:DNA-binding transcriptional ArsR family regulator
MVTHLRKQPVQRARTDGAFGAIADPTRRAILDLLRERELSAGEIAENFPVSRPAIARHVRVLRQAGLLRERRHATSRFYSADGVALQSVDAWLAPYRLFWAARLADLKRVVEEEQAAEAVKLPPKRNRKEE